MKYIQYCGKGVLFLFCMLFLSFSSWAKIPDDIFVGLKKGDVEIITPFLNSSIEMVVGEKEGIFSKDQAKMIVEDFFEKQKPSDFKILHQGGKEPAEYAIGNMSTVSGKYRVYFLLKTENNSSKIFQLRFELDEE